MNTEKVMKAVSAILVIGTLFLVMVTYQYSQKHRVSAYRRLLRCCVHSCCRHSEMPCRNFPLFRLPRI